VFAIQSFNEIQRDCRIITMCAATDWNVVAGNAAILASAKGLIRCLPVRYYARRLAC
jgi:hypothetical protein